MKWTVVLIGAGLVGLASGCAPYPRYTYAPAYAPPAYPTAATYAPAPVYSQPAPVIQQPVSYAAPATYAAPITAGQPCCMPAACGCQ